MDTRSYDALVLGVGNVLWADEGFGVRAVEALHEAYECPASVALLDGGTQGLYLMDFVTTARRLILFDAIDFGLEPGTLKVYRGSEVPAWSSTKLSAHQTGMNDLFALAKINGQVPEQVTLIGVQPVNLTDFGGSLHERVRARLPQAVALAVDQLVQWGLPARARRVGETYERLVATALSLNAYEAGRPDERSACRSGDERFFPSNAGRAGERS